MDLSHGCTFPLIKDTELSWEFCWHNRGEIQKHALPAWSNMHLPWRHVCEGEGERESTEGSTETSSQRWAKSNLLPPCFTHQPGRGKRYSGCLVEKTAKMKHKYVNLQLKGRQLDIFQRKHMWLILTCTHIWGCLSTADVMYICWEDTVGVWESYVHFNRGSITNTTNSPVKLTRLWWSSFSSSVELSTGMQRCSCCLQQREAEILRSPAGHSELHIKLDSCSAISEDGQTSL